ncbi:MAG TPA: hypothetical protein VG942_03720, partial [Hyphomonadaceae bacterium]|nr:hypothetical protein [Hyphomonadaceae bacterium]
RQPGYEHLMLCASPGMMSAIWAHLGDALHDQFVITLSKDVMRETPSEIDCRISRFMKACWPHLDAHRA